MTLNVKLREGRSIATELTFDDDKRKEGDNEWVKRTMTDGKREKKKRCREREGEGRRAGAERNHEYECIKVKIRDKNIDTHTEVSK